MSTYQEERRADRAAVAEQAREDRRLEAEQKRRDQEAADERRAARQREADEREARLAKQARADKSAGRRAKQAARAERRAARQAALTPGNVYRTGTLALVVASALGSLPAQVMHFAGISPMLLPLPLAIEGAAWVFAAGVAFADARRLPGWVRWLLRGFILAAAGFAATINYSYGRSLHGLTHGQATTAALGLAAVSLLGPLLFEIRQWVSTLDEKTGTAEDKARRKAEGKAEKERREHLARRRKHHKDIAEEADRLLSAAPYGSLSEEEAFATAWRIHRGTEPGMSPELYATATNSRVQLGAAFELGEHVRPELLRAGLMAAALNPFPTAFRTLGSVTPIAALSAPAETATTQAPSGLYGSETPAGKADEEPHTGRSGEELEALMPEAHRVAAELVAEGRQLSTAQFQKRLAIRREDAAKVRDRVVGERKLHAVAADAPRPSVSARVS